MSKVYTNGEDWWIARDRSDLERKMIDYYGHRDYVDEYLEDLEPMEDTAPLSVGYQKDMLPEWSKAAGFQVEDCEVFGDGWNVKIVADAQTFASQGPQDAAPLASTNY